MMSNLESRHPEDITMNLDQDSSPSASFPAPYGRACVNCSQSKCRCVMRRVGGRCERCHRMNKECRPSMPSRRRRNPKKPAVSKTARLEERLDDLVSLLRAGAQPAAIAADSSHETAPVDEQEHHHHSRMMQTNSTTSPYCSPVNQPMANNHYPLLNPAVLTPRTSVSSAPASTCPFETTPLEAEEYLTIFQTQMSKYFPFVYIPSTTTAQQLRQERPFLWLCIMAVSSKITMQQRALCKQIGHVVSEQMVHESTNSNIDLLLGLLAFIGWSNHQVYNKPNLSVFTQLAMSLVFDLGLNKPPVKEKHIMLCVHSQEDHNPSRFAPPVRTMEERRAVLGCFLVTSIMSAFLQKIDALRWTPHMDECLQVLDERRECVNDEILVQQVRFQLIIERVTLDSWYGGLAEATEQSRVPPSFYLQALQSQLQKVKNKLPPQLQQSEVLLAHLYSTTLMINESISWKSPILASRTLNFQQLECLYACLDSVKSWFDIFFTIPPAEYTGFPFSIFSQMVHCLIALYRLSTLEDPAWDRASVQKTADVLTILDRVINNMAQVATLSGLDSEPDGDIFSRIAKMYESIRVGWEAKLGRQPMVSHLAPTTTQSIHEALPDTIPVDFADHDWLMDILNSIN